MQIMKFLILLYFFCVSNELKYQTNLDKMQKEVFEPHWTSTVCE